MKARVLFWVLGVFLGVFSFSLQPVRANPLLVKDSIRLYTAPVGTHVSIQEIRQLSEDQWRPSDLNNSFGFIPEQDAWLRIPVTRLQDKSAYLVVYRANLQEVCFFSQTLESCRSATKSSDIWQTLPAAEPIFSLAHLLPEESVVYLRVHSLNYVIVPLSFVSHEALMYQLLLKRLLDFSAMGTFFSLLFLNLVLACWLKKSVYLLHAGALLSWSVAWFGLLMGYSRFLSDRFHTLVFGQMPFFAFTTMLCSIFAYQLFARHEFNQKIKRWLYFLSGLLALTLASFLLPLPSLHLVLTRLWALGMIIVVLLGLFFSLRLKRYWSAFYLFCWLAFYSSICVAILLQFSLLPFTLLTYSYFSWLQCLSMLTLALLPLLSVESVKRVADVLMMRNLMFALDQRQLLEKRVDERTLELKESVLLLEEANQKLTDLNRSKARLFVILAHDLRTPFLSMLALLNVFERGKVKRTLFLEMLPRLKNHLENVSASLDNMLTWVKAELDGYSHERQSLRVQDLIVEVQGMYEEPARQKQVDLKIHPISTGLRIWADRNHVRLVLRNIVGNALKFTPHEGTIEIWAVRVSEAQVRITIQDTGMGFSEADLERFRARESLSSQAGTSGEKGLGLGLQACLAYLEVNQGSLTITPSASGSCVQFTLPCASAGD